MQVRFLPIALFSNTAATEESTPPLSPSTTLSSPSCSLSCFTVVSINDDNEIYEQNIKEIAKLGEEFVELFKKNYKRPKITIEITSPGGSIYNGLGIYDFIRAKKENEGYNFECIASGFIASMATIIILSCEKRIGLPNTSFMIHSLSSLSYGKFQTLKENIEECERLNNILFEIYTNNT